MRDRYRLDGLGNDQLLAALTGLVRHDNALLADVLAHLAELDERKLFLDLGYPSLFAYCTRALGLCSATAGRRIAVARVCRRFPEAFVRIASGALQFSVVNLLGPHLSRENADELLDACSGKSCEQVEELLAARFPKPDVRESIRRLPSRATHSASSLDIGSESGRRLEPLSHDRFGVHFTADGEFRELLEEVRALGSHGRPAAGLLILIKEALKARKRELLKKRFGVGRKARRRRVVDAINASAEANDRAEAKDAVGAKGGARRSRYVPDAVAREVYLRDGGCCSFVSTDGRRCAARHFLEIDHVDPDAVGGASTAENLRLRCRAHNQQHARSYFGSAYVRAAMARVGDQGVGGELLASCTRYDAGRSEAGRSESTAAVAGD